MVQNAEAQKGIASFVLYLNTQGCPIDLNLNHTDGVLIMFFLVFRHLGETLPLSSGNKITLKFTTNGTETAKGFHFVYQGNFVFPDIFPQFWYAELFVALTAIVSRWGGCTHIAEGCSAECQWMRLGISEQSRMMWSQIAYPGKADESD